LSIAAVAAVTAALVAALLALAPGAQAGGPRVLILESTVTGGAASIEATQAASLGFAVDIVDATDWAAMDASDFGAYEGIILGDPTCTSRSAFQAAVDNAEVWGPVIDGNQILIGTDPVYHDNGGASGDGGETLTRQGIDFALSGSGDTGLYLTLSCFGGAEPEPLLAGLGTFNTVSTGCNDDIHIVATHPALGDLEDADLIDWGCSTHEGFTSWPDLYIPLAIQVTDVDPVFTAPDGTMGNPYILATGEGLEPTRAVNLSPESQTDDIGGSCDLTATVRFAGELVEGAEVFFSVTDGPHEGEEGSATTNAEGEATFSYTGSGAGTDTIIATWDREGTILESNLVTCTFEGEPTTTTTTTTAPPATPAVPTPGTPTFTG
jgi:hypothetical protein